MTEVQVPARQGAQDRVVYALRQAATLGLALLLAGLVTERLRPIEAVDRGIVSTQFIWAAVLWAVVLMVNALAFEHSQMQVLEHWPLITATGIGFIIFVIGIASFDAGELGRRLAYLAANSLGAAMFWWAAVGLCWLLVRRVAD